jgi:acyl-CoA thioesterase FadM
MFVAPVRMRNDDCDEVDHVNSMEYEYNWLIRSA